MVSTGDWIYIFVRGWSSGLTPFVPYFLLFICLTLIKMLTTTTKHSLRFQVKHLAGFERMFQMGSRAMRGGTKCKRPYGDNSIWSMDGFQSWSYIEVCRACVVLCCTPRVVISIKVSVHLEGKGSQAMHESAYQGSYPNLAYSQIFASRSLLAKRIWYTLWEIYCLRRYLYVYLNVHV